VNKEGGYFITNPVFMHDCVFTGVVVAEVLIVLRWGHRDLDAVLAVDVDPTASDI